MKTKTSIMLMAVVCATFLDLFIQLPIIANYGHSLGAVELVVGLMVAAYSISNMVGNFLAGRVIDKWGRKKSIKRGLAASALMVSLYGLYRNIYWLFFLRIFHGLALSVVNPAAYAAIGDSSKKENRGKKMATSGITIGLAAVIGPMLGGILKDRLGARLVFVLIGIIHLAASIVAAHIKEEQIEGEESKEQSAHKVKLSKPIVFAYISALCLMFANGTLTYLFPRNMQALGFKASIIGMGFSAFAIAAIILFATPLGRLSDKIGRYKPIYIALSFIVLSLVLLSIVRSLVPILLIMGLYGLGFGMIFPASSALLVDNTKSSERNTAFGIYYGVFSLGAFIGPIVSSWMISIGINGFLGSSLLLLMILIINMVILNTQRFKMQTEKNI